MKSTTTFTRFFVVLALICFIWAIRCLVFLSNQFGCYNGVINLQRTSEIFIGFNLISAIFYFFIKKIKLQWMYRLAMLHLVSSALVVCLYYLSKEPELASNRALLQIFFGLAVGAFVMVGITQFVLWFKTKFNF